MAFSIVLYNNKSEPEKLDKNLTEITTLTGTLKDPTSVIDPVILIETRMEDIIYCNYLRIERFNRRYFVNDIKSIRTGMCQLSCHVDVLSSFKTEIRKNTAILHRSENNYELDFDDGSIKTLNNPKITTKSFPSGFTTSIEFVLAVAGGSASE